MKRAFLTVPMTGLTVLCSLATISQEPSNKRAPAQGALSTPASLPPMTLPELRMLPLDKNQTSWPLMHRSLPLPERKIQNSITAPQMEKESSEQDRISKWTLENRERVLAGTRSDSQRIHESTAVDHRAVSLRVEESAQKPAKRSVRSARRPQRARARLIRYDGEVSWSIDEVGKVDSFFRKRFGRPLPVSALGQSLTHDHLGLDHSEAVDVAVRPDSAEGRGLMAYLRRAGIPFTAFRGKISRMSTGAHIHIGPPSPRLVIVERRSKDLEEPAEGAERS